MKIVVTSEGETLESRIDPRFGRAAKFILHDTETGESKAMDNAQNINAPQGAGIQAAETARQRFDVNRMVEEYLAWYQKILNP